MTHSTRRTAPKWTASKTLTSKSTVKLSKDYLSAQFKAYDKAEAAQTVSSKEWD